MLPRFFFAISTIAVALLLNFAISDKGFAQEKQEYRSWCAGVCGVRQIVPKCDAVDERPVTVKRGSNFPQEIWLRPSNEILRIQRPVTDRYGRYRCACRGDRACYPRPSQTPRPPRPPRTCIWYEYPYYKHDGDQVRSQRSLLFCNGGRWEAVR